MLFETPVAIEAGTLYVVSYHMGGGTYSYDHDYFASEVDRAPLYAPEADTVGGNGVYLYSDDPAFPSNGSSGTNYWVDVIFQPN